MLPNFGLAKLLFGDVNTAVGLYILPLPRAVALTCLIIFPLTIAFAELPSYYGYVMPRLAARWGMANPRAVLVPAFWLSAQHMMLPFIPDVRFVLYRLGMFFPLRLAARVCHPLAPAAVAVHDGVSRPYGFTDDADGLEGRSRGLIYRTGSFTTDTTGNRTKT